MAGFGVVPAGAFQPGAILNPGSVPFWDLNDFGASSAEGPLFSKNPWDLFKAKGRKFPGICRVNPGGVARLALNRAKAPGNDGARLTITGYDPKEFTVSIEIFTVLQWSELQDIIAHIWVIPGKGTPLDQVAVTVEHPNLQWLRISSAVLIGVAPLQPGSLKGSKIATFQFQEYVKPTKKDVTRTAKGSAVGVVPEFRKGQVPKNATPAPPSSDRKNARLTGPPSSPAGGTS